MYALAPADPEATLRVEPVFLAPLEEIFWRAEVDSVGAFRVAARLQLDGCLESEFLVPAFQHLQSRHPKLRAIVSRDNDGRWRYDLDREVPPIPFRITDYEEGEPPWREETRRLLEIQFPSTGPLAIAGILRNRPRRVSDLILVAHHAIADGMSVMALLDDLLTEYANLEAHLGAAPRPPLRIVAAARATQSAGWRSRLWLLYRFIRLRRDERRSRLTPLPAAADVPPPQSQWVHWVYSREDTQSLGRRYRQERTSLGGTLVAAAYCGLMDCLPVSRARFKCHFPFDVRASLQGVTAQDLGCFISFMTAFHEVPQPPSFWALARRAYDDVKSFVERGGPAVHYNMATAVTNPLWERVAPSLDFADQRTTLNMTSYGTVNIAEAYGSLRPRGCVINHNTTRVGSSITIRGLVLGQRLNIGLAADRLEPAFWDRLQKAVRKHLDAAATAG
jgi:hypothetical protein